MLPPPSHTQGLRGTQPYLSLLRGRLPFLLQFLMFLASPQRPPGLTPPADHDRDRDRDQGIDARERLEVRHEVHAPLARPGAGVGHARDRAVSPAGGGAREGHGVAGGGGGQASSRSCVVGAFILLADEALVEGEKRRAVRAEKFSSLPQRITVVAACGRGASFCFSPFDTESLLRLSLRCACFAEPGHAEGVLLFQTTFRWDPHDPCFGWTPVAWSGWA